MCGGALRGERRAVDNDIAIGAADLDLAFFGERVVGVTTGDGEADNPYA